MQWRKIYPEKLSSPSRTVCSQDALLLILLETSISTKHLRFIKKNVCEVTYIVLPLGKRMHFDDERSFEKLFSLISLVQKSDENCMEPNLL